METLKFQSYQSNPEEKEQSRKHNPSRLQTIIQKYKNFSQKYKQYGIGARTHTHTHTPMAKRKHPDQCNRIESAEINLNIQSQSSIKETRIYNEKKIIFSASGLGKVNVHACMYAKSLRQCVVLYDPMDCSLPSSSAHGILQAKILEWVAMHSYRGSSQLRDQTHISCISFTGGGFFRAKPLEKTGKLDSHM